MDRTAEAEQLFEYLDLTEYETTALKALFAHGRSTAPNLVEATGIPKARIYGVLEELGNRGFIKIIPGRPKKYQPKSPRELLDRAIENRKQEFESFQSNLTEIEAAFVETFEPQYQQTSEDISPTEELFHVVDVGEPSESETRAIYRNAEETVHVLTKSFEYLDSVEQDLQNAVDRGVTVDILLVHPKHLSDENAAVQQHVRTRLRQEFPSVSIRFSEQPLPWRGTLADPSMDYETGIAIVLVEEKNVPLHMRQAAVTENASFVAGLKRYFDLIWEYESVSADRLD
jgi:sugar-specific transcriptional regulator TrmB